MILWLLPVLAITSCQQGSVESDILPTPSTTLHYQSPSGSTGTLSVFQPPEAGRPTPAIVMFHGGGWRGGSPSSLYVLCHNLAQRGFTAISASYTTSPRGRDIGKIAAIDGAAAFREVLKHADELGIDSCRIAIGGESAGGHIAALISAQSDVLFSFGSFARPNAAVLISPVIDNSADGFGHDLLGDEPLLLSPIHLVDDDFPPGVLIIGDRDPLISIQVAREFSRRAGNRVEVITVDGGGHVLDTGRSGGHVDQRITEAIDSFFLREGWITRDPQREDQ